MHSLSPRPLTSHCILWVSNNNRDPCLWWAIANVGVGSQWSTVAITATALRVGARHYKRKGRRGVKERVELLGHENRTERKCLEWSGTLYCKTCFNVLCSCDFKADKYLLKVNLPSTVYQFPAWGIGLRKRWGLPSNCKFRLKQDFEENC